MKKISILAVAALAMFSCSKNVNVNPNDNSVDDQISFVANVSGIEKGSYTAFDDATNAVTAIDGDKFGVFMVADANTVAATNVEFTYSGGLFTTNYATAPASNLTWAGLLNNSPSQLDFYSYYPYSSTSTTYTAIPVVVPTTQIMGTKDASGAYTKQRTVTSDDFLFSRNNTTGADKTLAFTQGDVPADRTVRFTYAHALAMVEFNVLNSAAIADNTWLTSIALSGNKIYTTGTIDLSDATPAVAPDGTTGTLTIAPNTPATTPKLVSETDKDKSTAIYQMLVMPMNAATTADAEITIVAQRGGASYANSSSKTYKNQFPDKTTWEAGHRYKYNVVIAENTIRVDLVEIEDWIPEEGGNIVTPPAN